jgi:DNA (cytosine-5)-methyltransferase 1
MTGQPMADAIVDPFAGVGWAEGLRRLGLREVGIDLDPAVCATRRAAGFDTVRADVAAYPVVHLAGKVTGLIASPPCQAFSRAGKRLGMRDLPAIYAHVATVKRAGRWVPYPAGGWHDPRSPLVLEPLRWTLETRPEWVALEQVEDVLPLWRSFTDVLEGLGWSTWAGILCAADYGVAQERYRAIMLAHRGRRAVPPAPTHHEHGGADLLGGDLPRWVSMAQALGWDGTLDPLINSTMGGGRVERYYRKTDRPAPVVRTNGDRWRLRDLDQPAPTIVPGGRLNDISWVLRTGNHDRAFDRSIPRPLSEPAPTVAVGYTLAQWAWERPATTVQGDPRVPRPGHRDRAGGEHQQDQAVRVTLAELAILQGFPADFPFQGNKTQRAQQIGNAVPPPLAAAIIGALVGIDWRRADPMTTSQTAGRAASEQAPAVKGPASTGPAARPAHQSETEAAINREVAHDPFQMGQQQDASVSDPTSRPFEPAFIDDVELQPAMETVRTKRGIL